MVAPELDESTRMAKRFEALGDPSRLRIVAHLMSTYPEGTYSRELHAELGVARSELEPHLVSLASLGVLHSFDDGKTSHVYYRVDIDAVRGFMDYVWNETSDDVIVR